MPLTIENLRNPACASGYDHVDIRPPSDGRKNLYRAQIGGGGSSHRWRGPRRLTAEEAAQDYCDYINGLATPPVPRVKQAGHKSRRSRTEKPLEIVEAERKVREWRKARDAKRPGFVYCIAEAEGLHPQVKIGYSKDPEGRPAELQTGNGRRLFLMGYFAGTEADEKALHAKYIEDNTLAEWFRPSDALLSEFGFDMYDLYKRGSKAVRGM